MIVQIRVCFQILEENIPAAKKKKKKNCLFEGKFCISKKIVQPAIVLGVAWRSWIVLFFRFFARDLICRSVSPSVSPSAGPSVARWLPGAPNLWQSALFIFCANLFLSMGLVWLKNLESTAKPWTLNIGTCCHQLKRNVKWDVIVHPSVCPSINFFSIHPSVHPLLRTPQTLLAGPQTPPAWKTCWRGLRASWRDARARSRGLDNFVKMAKFVGKSSFSDASIASV